MAKQCDLKSMLSRNLSRKCVPRYMRVVEDIRYQPAGTFLSKEQRKKEVVHFVEMHSGRISLLLEDISHYQVYVARDLGQVSRCYCSCRCRR